MAASKRRPQPGKSPPRSTNPVSPAGARSEPVQVTWTTPDASPLRHRIEVTSRDLLVRVQRLPRWLLFAAALLLTFGGAALPGWGGAACLLLIAFFLIWLLYLAWPALNAGGRAVRLLMGAGIAAVAVVRAVRG